MENNEILDIINNNKKIYSFVSLKKNMQRIIGLLLLMFIVGIILICVNFALTEQTSKIVLLSIGLTLMIGSLIVLYIFIYIKRRASNLYENKLSFKKMYIDNLKENNININLHDCDKWSNFIWKTQNDILLENYSEIIFQKGFGNYIINNQSKQTDAYFSYCNFIGFSKIEGKTKKIKGTNFLFILDLNNEEEISISSCDINDGLIEQMKEIELNNNSYFQLINKLVKLNYQFIIKSSLDKLIINVTFPATKFAIDFNDFNKEKINIKYNADFSEFINLFKIIQSQQK
ncbi:MAG: hypothetical protein ACRC4L_00945 [Mycoplasma sp.]